MSHVTKYSINAPQYFFTEKDIGRKFVRAKPYIGVDWSYTLLEPTELAINKCALELTAIHPKYLEFTQFFLKKKEVVKLEAGGKAKGWNDGFWVPLEKCLEMFAKNLPNLVFNTHGWHDDNDCCNSSDSDDD